MTNYAEVARPKRNKNAWDDYDDDLDDLTKTRKIFIEVPAQLHNEIKSRAASRGINMRKYVLRAVFDRMKKEELEGNK